MKKTKRTTVAISTAVILASTMCIPTAAYPLHIDSVPLAKTLETMQTDDEGCFLTASPALYYYLTDDDLVAIDTTKICYVIQLERGGIFSDDVVSQLEKVLESYGSYGVSNIKIGDDAADSNSVVLEDCGDGKYVLTLNPAKTGVQEAELFSYLQTVPSFISVQKEVFGYSYEEAGIGFYCEGIQSFGYEDQRFLLVQTKDGAALTTDDLSEISGIADVKESKTYTWNKDGEVSYVLCADPDVYSTGLGNQGMIEMVRQVESLEQVERVALLGSFEEIPSIPESVSGGAIPYVTRGDCDENETIDANDAYLALQHYAAGSVGSASVLSDRNRCAADINGNGKVDADDAYLMLKYYAAKSVGSDTQWSDILQ
ncbi:dockerin type I domain-containing protein [Ruminococcus sp.]|uniref:dockerin type I domain-containing protein n=1 Tax=Ruminococcus sp. TaxID=41978 RepID=UPI0025E12F88|nr:dockerin type I domain-containing protein [Ruminococcus sp.]